MKLYINKSECNVIGKEIVEVMDIDIRLRSNINVINPSIKIVNNGVDFNYCYIKKLNRFYFVDSKIVRGTIIDLILRLDVLETYKKEIRSGVVFAEVEVSDGDYGIINPVSVESFKEIITHSTVELIPSKNLIFTTMGDGENG